MKDIEQIPEKVYDPGREHPTPEQLFMREAMKHLTPRQRAVWEYHNYDRMTQDEIAIRCGISQVMVLKHIRACEARIEKWCFEHIWVYEMLREQGAFE